jgi:hypothetical protein
MECFVSLAVDGTTRPAVPVPALDVAGTLVQVRLGGEVELVGS